MEYPTLDDIRDLLSATGPCVSIFMPTHAAAPDNRQDPLQLRELLREAESRLAERGVRQADVTALLAAARELADDGLFWRPRPGGVAVYASMAGTRVYRTRDALEPAAAVEDRFRIRPLLGTVDRGERFFVLALSQHSVRLYRGDRESLTEIDLGDTPRSLDEALRNDGYDQQLQMHSSTGAPAPGGGRGGAIFHGSAPESGATTRYLTEFAKRVATSVRDLVPDRRSPFVLAAVGELVALYREADHEHPITAATVAGNPESLSVSDLHAAAWAAARAAGDAARDAGRARLAELAGTGRAAQIASDVVAAAAQGRVEALFVASDASCFGRYDERTGAADARPEAMPGDDDLVDLAAARTIASGGTVHVIEGAGTPLAAILRY